MKEFWKSKYALGDLSLDEFWSSCRPEGKIYLFYFQSKCEVDHWLWKGMFRVKNGVPVLDDPYILITLKDNPKISFKFDLNQKIKINKNSIMIVEYCGKVCTIIFDSAPNCAILD